MSQPSNKVNPFDPLSFWRTTQDATLEAWSKAMIDFVNSEPYAEATARLLDTYLSVSAPVRKLLSQTMAQVLTQLNMPTEAEVTGLAERLTNIEMRLDDLDARLDTIVRKLDTLAAAQHAQTAIEPPAPRTSAASRRGAAGGTTARGGARNAASNGAAPRRRTRPGANPGTEPPANP